MRVWVYGGHDSAMWVTKQGPCSEATGCACPLTTEAYHPSINSDTRIERWLFAVQITTVMQGITINAAVCWLAAASPLNKAPQAIGPTMLDRPADGLPSRATSITILHVSARIMAHAKLLNPNTSACTLYSQVRGDNTYVAAPNAASLPASHSNTMHINFRALTLQTMRVDSSHSIHKSAVPLSLLTQTPR